MVRKQNESPIIISVGGSLIVPNGGIDDQFLSKLNRLIRREVEAGKRFCLITGGGKTTRHYQKACQAVVGKMSHEDLDWLGIHATRLNGHLLRTIFQDIAHPRVIDHYDNKLENWREPILIGAGWKPGWSTDYNAVILARNYGIKLIINLTNVNWVYENDPKKVIHAKPIKRLSWTRMEKLVGKKWIPGLNFPFDPVAIQMAKKLKLTVIITNGRNFDNLQKIIDGRDFIGTVIEPS